MCSLILGENRVRLHVVHFISYHITLPPDVIFSYQGFASTGWFINLFLTRGQGALSHWAL